MLAIPLLGKNKTLMQESRDADGRCVCKNEKIEGFEFQNQILGQDGYLQLYTGLDFWH